MQNTALSLPGQAGTFAPRAGRVDRKGPATLKGQWGGMTSAAFLDVRQTRLSPLARLLFQALDNAAGMKTFCWPGNERLADSLGVTERYLQMLLRELENPADGNPWILRIDAGGRKPIRLGFVLLRRCHPTYPAAETPEAIADARAALVGRKPVRRKPPGGGTAVPPGSPPSELLSTNWSSCSDPDLARTGVHAPARTGVHAQHELEFTQNYECSSSIQNEPTHATTTGPEPSSSGGGLSSTDVEEQKWNPAIEVSTRDRLLLAAGDLKTRIGDANLPKRLRRLANANAPDAGYIAAAVELAVEAHREGKLRKAYPYILGTYPGLKAEHPDGPPPPPELSVKPAPKPAPSLPVHVAPAESWTRTKPVGEIEFPPGHFTRPTAPAIAPAADEAPLNLERAAVARGNASCLSSKPRKTLPAADRPPAETRAEAAERQHRKDAAGLRANTAKSTTRNAGLPATEADAVAALTDAQRERLDSFKPGRREWTLACLGSGERLLYSEALRCVTPLPQTSGATA